LGEEMYECYWRVGHFRVGQRRHDGEFCVIILELRDLD